MNPYELRRLVSLGTTVTISLVLVFGSVLLSPSVINVALGVDMPDAPVTQDTVTPGKDDDNDEGNDQSDSLPDPEDAPITTETITSGGNEGSKEDKSNEKERDETNAGNNNPTVSAADPCPKDQERMLFELTCTQLDNENTVGIEPTNSQSNECVIDPLNVGCQNTASQIQGDDNTAALAGEQ